MNTPRIFRLAAAGLVLAVWMAGTDAAAQSPSRATAAGPKLPVKFGWQPQADFVFQTARASGTYEAAGLALEYVQFPSGREMMAALQSKSIDTGHASGIIFNVALAAGLDVKAIYVYQDHARNEGLVALADSGIRKVEDLAGKRVAYTKGSAAHYVLSKALAHSGLSPAKLTLVDLTPDKAFGAFINRNVDAWWVWQPWRAKAEAEGGKLIISDKELGLSIPAVWFARAEWIAQNPEAASRLALAAALAVEQLKRDKSVGVKAMAKALTIPEEMASRIFEQDYLPTPEELLDEKSYLSMTSPKGLGKVLGEIGDFLHEQKIVRQRPEPNKAIDPKPLREALQLKLQLKR